MNRRTFTRALAAVPSFGLFGGERVAAAPEPNMIPGEVYCLGCDADRLLPGRIGPQHVAVRFISNYERRHTDIYLHDEKVPHVYEVLGDSWAIVGADARPRGCGRFGGDADLPHVLVRFVRGPYQVRMFS